MAQDKGHANPAPSAIDGSLPTTVLSARSGSWVRIARLGPNYYSSDPRDRYSSARIPGGVLYIGEDSKTCFWEVFWDTLQSRAGELRIDRQKIIERRVYEATLKREFVVFDATNPSHLKKTGANCVGCFNGEYEICRGWAAVIYEAKENVDGILYPSARSGGQRNLALFGGRSKKEHVRFNKSGKQLMRDVLIRGLLTDEEIGWL